MKNVLLIGCAVYMLNGLGGVIYGALLPVLYMHYGIGAEDGGRLVFIQFAGLMAGVLSSPLWIRRLGRRTIVTTGLSLVALSYAVISTLPPWPIFVAAAFPAGYAIGLTESTIGSFVIESVRERKAVAMSWLEVFFGAGALVMPAIAAAAIRLDAIWAATAFLAGLAFVLLLLILPLRMGEVDRLWRMPAGGPRDQASREAAGAVRPRFRIQPVFLFFAAFFFLYVGIEMSIVSFLPTIMLDKGIPGAAAASLGVTLFWAAMTLGRSVAGLAAEKITYTRYLMACCLLSVVFLAGLAAAEAAWLQYVFTALLGLAMAGLFGIALVYANGKLPGTTERTTSLLIASGGVGGSVFPLVTGWGLTVASDEAVLLALAAATALMLAALLLAGRRRRHPVPRGLAIDTIGPDR